MSRADCLVIDAFQLPQVRLPHELGSLASQKRCLVGLMQTPAYPAESAQLKPRSCEDQMRTDQPS